MFLIGTVFSRYTTTLSRKLLSNHNKDYFVYVCLPVGCLSGASQTESLFFETSAQYIEVF